MPFQPDNPPRVFSILAGREVSTWSEEWKEECEVRFLAEMPLAKRNPVLDGVKDEPRGIKNIRGDAAVVRLRRRDRSLRDIGQSLKQNGPAQSETGPSLATQPVRFQLAPGRTDSRGQLTTPSRDKSCADGYDNTVNEVGPPALSQ